MKEDTKSAAIASTIRRRWGGREPVYVLGVWLFRLYTALRFALRVTGGEHMPESGAFILAANHVSPHDPVAIGAVAHRLGRRLRAVTLARLFSMPVVGWVLRHGGQIPIERGGGGREGLLLALAALRAGQGVLIYPEGGIVRPGEQREARTGVGRLALLSGAPVLPVTSWGLRPPPGPRGWFRSPAGLVIGPPVDLSPWQGRRDHRAAREAADRILDAIRAQLPAAERLARGARPPTPPDAW